MSEAQGFRVDDKIRNRNTYRKSGSGAPIWCVTQVYKDGTLEAWSNHRGSRHIKRPENYFVINGETTQGGK